MRDLMTKIHLRYNGGNDGINDEITTIFVGGEDAVQATPQGYCESSRFKEARFLRLTSFQALARTRKGGFGISSLFRPA